MEQYSAKHTAKLKLTLSKRTVDTLRRLWRARSFPWRYLRLRSARSTNTEEFSDHYAMKRTRFVAIVGVIVPSIVLASCQNSANRLTIERATPIPQLIQKDKQSNVEDKRAEGGAIAIHLDAQQRLVLVTARGYCAEPSPDALSAYVATLGLGAATPSEAAASFASALQGSVASIGLRTQSITLMRDALYRMCEAANNGKLDELQVARFLRRSQDLTAVVLAIEQLTGVVAANQVILTPQSSADASANLVANQQLLDQARQTVETHKQAVKAAQDELAAAQLIRNNAKAENDNKQTAYKVANEKANASDTSPTNTPGSPPQEPAPENPSQKPAAEGPKETDRLSQLEAEAKEAKSALETAEKLVKGAKSHLALVKQRLKDAEEVLKVIETSRNAALTNATSDTQSSGQFSSMQQRNKLDQGSTEAISKAVTKMVSEVLAKDDTAELCVSYVISDRALRQGQQQIMASADKEVASATIAAANARKTAVGAEKVVIAKDEAHLSAIAAFEAAQNRANILKNAAEKERLDVRQLNQQETPTVSNEVKSEGERTETSAEKTGVEEKLREAEAKAREAEAKAREAEAKAREAEAKARELEVNARKAEIELATAEKLRDLAREAANEEKKELERLRARRDKLVQGATTVAASEKIGDLAKSICEQLLLPEP